QVLHIGEFGMLYYEETIFFEQIVGKYKFRYPGEFFRGHFIRRVGKNNICSGTGLVQETEHITSNGPDGKIKFPGCFLDKLYASGVCIYGSYGLASAAGKFVTDIARSCKKIKNSDFLQVKMVFKDVEKCFFCKIGCWAYRQFFWGH